MAKNCSKLPLTNKILNSSVVSMTLHLTCATEVIILPNKVFKHFYISVSYNFYISLKSVKKRITPEL